MGKKSIAASDFIRKLEVVSRRFTTRYLQELSKSGVTPAEASILIFLGEYDGRPGPCLSDIGDTLPGRAPPSRIIETFREKVWVTEENSKVDRRKWHFSLTAAGRRKYKSVSKVRQRHIQWIEENANSDSVSACLDLLDAFDVHIKSLS